MTWLESVIPRLVLGAGAALLVASLFMPWFAGVDPTFEDGVIPGTYVSGWEAFSNVDVLLAMAAVGAFVVLFIADALEAGWAYLGVVVIGGAAFCLTLYAIYRPSGAAAVGSGGSPEIGFLCSLLGAGGITVGGLWCGLSPDDA